MEIPRVKLQAVYKLIEQLYVGGVNCLKATRNVPGPPRNIIDMLNELSTVPEWIKELKMSACRRGAMSALALAKAYHPEMDPALLAGGFLEFNADDTPFTEKDFQRVIKKPGMLELLLLKAWIYLLFKSDMMKTIVIWTCLNHSHLSWFLHEKHKRGLKQVPVHLLKFSLRRWFLSPWC